MCHKGKKNWRAFWTFHKTSPGFVHSVVCQKGSVLDDKGYVLVENVFILELCCGNSFIVSKTEQGFKGRFPLS